MPLWLSRIMVAFALGIPHVAAAIALYHLCTGRAKTSQIWLTLLYWLVAGLGITIGFHRYGTHKGFETGTILKGLLYIMGSMAGQGSVFFWIWKHLRHHAFSDTIGDPHSPWAGFGQEWYDRVFGFLRAHLGWLFDPTDRKEQEAYIPTRLSDDQLVVWIDKLYPVWTILSLLIPVLIQRSWRAGILCSLTAQAIRYEITWCVNSVCHIWGSRPFKKIRDMSTNNWIVGWLGLGEGWHRNHHAFQGSAFHGLMWWQFDISGWIIFFLEKLTQIRKVTRPKLSQIIRLSDDPNIGRMVNPFFVDCDVDRFVSHPELIEQEPVA